MKRVLLDTNIYGRIVEKQQEEETTLRIESRQDVIIYGLDVIRKELRATSQRVHIGRQKLRLVLLGIYDRLTQRHILYTTTLVEKLARDYFAVYRQLGGKTTQKEIWNDFLIVACASVHELDIVVSDDKDTMLSKEALTAYAIVNKLKEYRVPNFIGYETFVRLLTL